MLEQSWLTSWAKNEAFIYDLESLTTLDEETLVLYCDSLIKTANFEKVIELLREVSRRDNPELSERLLQVLIVNEQDDFNDFLEDCPVSIN